MKQYKNYENGDFYPQKKEFKILVPVKFKGQTKTVEFFDEEGYKQEVGVYKKKTKELHEQFKQDLFEDLDIKDNPKRDMFFEKIWDMGSSEGFERVYELAVDWVDLIR